MPLIRPIPETGRQLRAWRRYHAITQARLAASLGVSASTIGRWERGDVSLPDVIRDLFPTPPALTLRTGRPGRQPTKADLARATSAMESAAKAAEVLRLQYVRSVQDAVTAIVKTFDTVAVQRALGALTAQLVPIQQILRSGFVERAAAAHRAASDQLGAMQRSLQPMLEQVARAVQVIAAAFPTEEEFRRVSSVLADRGWFLGREFPIGAVREMDALLSTGDDAGVESLMQEYARDRMEAVLDAVAEQSPARSELLRAAADAHHEGRYSLSIPVFLAQVDGVAQDMIGGHLFQGRRKKTAAGRGFDKKLAELGITLDDGWLLVMLAPIYDGASIGIHTDERDRRRGQDPQYGPLNRHGVLHGIDTDYATEGNSLRAVLLLEYLLSVKSVLERRPQSKAG